MEYGSRPFIIKRHHLFLLPLLHLSTSYIAVVNIWGFLIASFVSLLVWFYPVPYLIEHILNWSCLHQTPHNTPQKDT
jgi:hypothetical protein